MRLAAFLSTTLIAAATAFAVQASPVGPVSTINITIGQDLAAKAGQYGERELDRLTADLRQSVERELAREGGLAKSGATLDLVIEDATPNRPTIRQMSLKPGLSFESYGIGGAEISGVLTTADGRSAPVGFRWYETDIRWSAGAATWSDAENTFDRFARRLARGDAFVD